MAMGIAAAVVVVLVVACGTNSTWWFGVLFGGGDMSRRCAVHAERVLHVQDMAISLHAVHGAVY